MNEQTETEKSCALCGMVYKSGDCALKVVDKEIYVCPGSCELVYGAYTAIKSDETIVLRKVTL